MGIPTRASGKATPSTNPRSNVGNLMRNCEIWDVNDAYLSDAENFFDPIKLFQQVGLIFPVSERRFAGFKI